MKIKLFAQKLAFTLIIVSLVGLSVVTRPMALTVTGNDSITVSGNVAIEEVQFQVYPEKRVPSTGNWSTVATVQFRNCSTGAVLYSASGINTNSSGVGTVNLSGTPITGGSYRFAIKGASHLNRVFGCYSLTTAATYINLTLEGKLLIAGEISNIIDNYINSLDISVLINALYSANYYSDLNQDGDVNSLDVSNLIVNLYTTGDS